jgi:hypothetical protein
MRRNKNGKGFSQNKYKNKKVVIDGITFASRAESQRYLDLKEMQARGSISSFTIQERLLLQKPFEKDNKKYREIQYIADFKVVEKDGTIWIEDVKGSQGFQTDLFKVKWKLAVYKYPEYKFRIIIITKKKT